MSVLKLCFTIKKNFLDLGCAQGSAGCVRYDNHVEDYGKPDTELRINSNNELYLNYSTTEKPTECVNNPVTTITFKCPTRGMVGFLTLSAKYFNLIKLK